MKVPQSQSPALSENNKVSKICNHQNLRRVVLLALLSYFTYVVVLSFIKWQEEQIGTLFTTLDSETAQVNFDVIRWAH